MRENNRIDRIDGVDGEYRVGLIGLDYSVSGGWFDDLIILIILMHVSRGGLYFCTFCMIC